MHSEENHSKTTATRKTAVLCTKKHEHNAYNRLFTLSEEQNIARAFNIYYCTCDIWASSWQNAI